MELWDKANQLHLDGKLEEAEKLYDDLLTQNPEHAGLLATFGTLCLQMNRFGMAAAFLHHSLEVLRKKKAEIPSDILSNLGLAYKYSGQHDSAMKYMKLAVANNPTPESLVVYGSMFVEQNDPEKCIEINKRAIAKDDNKPMAHWNMALAMLESGKWETAWDEHEWGFEAKIRADRALGDMPRWDGTPGKTVCVYGEQGIGDEIMFASMLPDLLKTNPVIFECHKRLKHLFEHSFPGVICHGTREDTEIHWKDEFDYQISVGSLGKYFRRSKESFPGLPYLKAESAPKGEKFRIGISWTGGFKANRIAKRTVPLSWWKDIITQDVEVVSLQYTDCEAEIAEVESKFGIKIKQFPEIKADDYYETAKLVMSCDLVISVCTSVIHLAGALGVPCWVLTPAHPAWRYQNKGPMPWYKSVRLYRQPENEVGAWIPVIGRIAKDLSEMVEEKNPQPMVAYG